MALDEHQKGIVIHVDFGRSSQGLDVEAALTGTIYSDAYCTAVARRVNGYWQRKPKKNYSAIRYDAGKKLFILTSRSDSEVPMSPGQFYRLVKIKDCLNAETPPASQKTDPLILVVSARLSDEIRKTLK